MNLFGFEIRTATVADYGQLCVLFDELNALHRQARPDLFRKPDGPSRELADVTALIAGPGSTILVAEDSAFRHLVGFVAILTRDLPASNIRLPRKMAEIDMIGVRQHARRQGVGRALVREAFQWAAAEGLGSVELGVYEFNAAAMAFYARMGFRGVVRRMCRTFSD
jgi:ribosomal protein S18 acetylase RimI-like enzyme